MMVGADRARWKGLVAAIVFPLALAAGLASCGDAPRSLVYLQVTGDQAYPDVTLTVTANGATEKTFDDVSFDQTVPASIGMYLPASVSGTVMFVGVATGAGCLRGQGTAVLSGLQGGMTFSSPVPLAIRRVDGCSDGGAGMGGAPETGAGGSNGAGGGPSSGGTGGAGPAGDGGAGVGGQTGAGGVVGSGGAGAGGIGIGTGGVAVGTGGRGSGGAPAIGTGGQGTGGAGTGGTGTGGHFGVGGGGGTGPCSGLCDSPLTLGTAMSYNSSGVGIQAYCAEATPPANLQGVGCANLTTRTFMVNGTSIVSGSGSCVVTTPPAKRNGGYCFQISAGQPTYTSFYYF